MSNGDRTKWDTRYREGAYAERGHPSVFLVDCLSIIQLPVNKALDLACGAGRNALYLASLGFDVDAVDISAEALLRGSQAAEAASFKTISWIEQDLDDGLPAEPSDGVERYGLVIMMRYLDVALLRSAAKCLVPGGYVLAEVHLQTDQQVAGPSSANFRAAAGELKTAALGLEIIQYAETVCHDPDGSTVALARLLAQKKQ